MPQRIFVSKEDREAPAFKAGSDSLALLLCANIVVFIIRTALIHKAVNP